MARGYIFLATFVIGALLAGMGLPSAAAANAPVATFIGGGVLDDIATPAERDAQFSLSVRFRADGSADGHFTLQLDTGETYKMEAERGMFTPDGVFVQGPVLKWDFKTRCQGCGNPWLGDIAAASGFTSSTNYRLYSVTGQPTPVGEAQSGDYHLKSGFIHSSQN